MLRARGAHFGLWAVRLPSTLIPHRILNLRSSLVYGNLYSGEGSPVPFPLGDITTLLPCEENEFSLGIVPKERAAFPGSSAALHDPSLISSSSRSLFGALIEAYSLWGKVARSTGTRDRKQKIFIEPWNPQSKYSQLSSELRTWEAGLDRRHQWSEWYLRAYKTQCVDLVLDILF